MPYRDASEQIAVETAGWSWHFHQYPELLFDLPQTAAVVAQKLWEFGCDEIDTRPATAGVTDVIKGAHREGRTVAFHSGGSGFHCSSEVALEFGSARGCHSGAS